MPAPKMNAPSNPTRPKSASLRFARSGRSACFSILAADELGIAFVIFGAQLHRIDIFEDGLGARRGDLLGERRFRAGPDIGFVDQGLVKRAAFIGSKPRGQ